MKCPKIRRYVQPAVKNNAFCYSAVHTSNYPTRTYKQQESETENRDVLNKRGNGTTAPANNHF
jgi:hypothetical protein